MSPPSNILLYKRYKISYNKISRPVHNPLLLPQDSPSQNLGGRGAPTPGFKPTYVSVLLYIIEEMNFMSSVRARKTPKSVHAGQLNVLFGNGPSPKKAL